MPFVSSRGLQQFGTSGEGLGDVLITPLNYPRIDVYFQSSAAALSASAFVTDFVTAVAAALSIEPLQVIVSSVTLSGTDQVSRTVVIRSLVMYLRPVY
jgi:hypothetical protein